MDRIRCESTLLLLVLLMSSFRATAQTAQRSAIVGAVTDASHAVLVGANVTLAGSGLPGGHVNATTDASGTYRFNDLLPVDYTLTVAAPGFKTVVRRGLQLAVDRTVTIDFAMEVSSVAETVDVDAPSPLVDVRSAGSAPMLPNTLLQSLPTSRSLVDLLNLTPGVGIGIVYTGVQGSSIAYGGTQGSNGVAIDGVSLVESNNGDARIAVNYDWLDHVEVVALGANAEYGGTTGATASGVLRSGTNQFAGLVNYLWTRPGWVSDNTESLPSIWRNLRKPVPLTTWYDTDGQVGGPLVRNRVWFFAGLDYLHHISPPSGPLNGVTDERRPRSLVKLDAAPGSKLRLQGFYERDAADIEGSLATSSVATIRNHIWNVRAMWTPTSATTVDARISGFREYEDSEPRSPFTRAGPPYVTDNAGLPATGAANFSELHQRSISTAASVTHYQRGVSGFHEFKVGVEREDAPTDYLQGWSGGRSYTAYNGVLQTVEFWDGQHNLLTNRRTTFYGQDRWSPADRLTFELGLRLDVNRGSVPVLGSVFSSSPVGPRVGVAWDVVGDHRTVVRAHYGRYHDQLFSSLYARKDVSAYSVQTTYQIVDGQLGNIVFRQGPPGDVTIPADVAQPHVDQWTVGAEREIARDVAVEVQYIRRNFGSFIGYVDPQLNAYPLVSVRDPGPDGIFGTSDDGGVVQVAQVLNFDQRSWLLTNPENAWRHYNAVQVVTRKRESHRWQIQGSYTWTQSSDTVDNIDHTNIAQGTLSPLAGIGGNSNVANQGAGQPTFAFSDAKLLGSWRAPWWDGFLISGVARWQTGVRWNRIFFSGLPGYPLVNAEPVGSRVGPSIATLDLRVEKTVTIPRTQARAGVMVDVFNLTNSDAPLIINPYSGPTFGLPNTLVPPRSVRAGLRVTF